MTKTRRTREQWQQLIRDWQASQLPITDFCSQHRIAESNFYYWRKKLDVDSAMTQTPVSTHWVDMTNEMNAEAVQSWHMELSLPGGAVLRIRHS